MKIAIIGTRGIPNNYGGFEQCAEYLATGLVKKGFDVTVYNSHNHLYQDSEWNGVKIIHEYDPENQLGTAGQFIYDLNCILDCRKKNYDIILQLGYTSSSIWGMLLPWKKSIITTNMDGLEWKRSKFSKLAQKFLLHAESLAVKYSNHLISDSIGIQTYLKKKYNKDSTYIPYGANLFNSPDSGVLIDFSLSPQSYDMLVARLEPENSIETILEGTVKSGLKRTFLVIGNHKTKYGEFLKNKYADHAYIKFIGGIYDINILNNLRHYSRIYLHGHTVGGTNPSLLEAMASNSLICANDNPFNKHILGQDAMYFKTADDVANHLINVDYDSTIYQQMISNNRAKIVDLYSWDNIIEQYATHFEEIAELVPSSQKWTVYQKRKAVSLKRVPTEVAYIK